MKTLRLFYSFILLGYLTSCQSNHHFSDDEVVCETVHRYGVPLQMDDWSARGQNGQIISMRKDGSTITRSYESGVLHGECQYTFPYSDTLQNKEIYHHGTLMQEFTYYPSGLPWQQITYESPGHSLVVAWYESGAPQYREEIDSERLMQGEYYHLNQQLESNVAHYQGLKTKRDGTGQLQSVDTIQDGQLILSTVYHPNGNPAAISPYVNDVIEGERRTYLPGGEPATIETWKDNLQHGTTIVYENGEKRAEVPYVNGCKHGIEQRYRDEQTVLQEINWFQGEQHGPSYSYIGDTSQVDWYFQGRKVPNRATYDMLCNQ